MRLSGDRVRRGVRVGLAVVAIGALAFVLYGERAELARTLSLTPQHFALITVFVFASWVTTSAAHWAMLRVLAVRISGGRMLALHVAAGLLNHLPLRPGMLYRAQYLKLRGSLRYAHFGSLMLMNLIVLVFAAGVVGAVSVVAGYGLEDFNERGLFAAFVLLSVLGGGLLFFRLPRFRKDEGWRRHWNQVVIGRERIRHHPRMVLVLFLVHVSSCVFGAMRLLGAFRALGVDIDFVGCVVLGAVGAVSLFIGLTPAGLGIQEFLVGTSAYLLGVQLGTAIIAATIVRAVLIFWYAIVGLPALVVLGSGEDRGLRE